MNTFLRNSPEVSFKIKLVKNNLLKFKIVIIILLQFLIFNGIVYSQPGTMYINQDVSGTYSNYSMTKQGGAFHFMIQENASGTSSGTRNWQFNSDSYYNTWGTENSTNTLAGFNQVIPPNTSTASANWQANVGYNAYGKLPQTQPNYYYSYNIIVGSSYASQDMCVLETSFDPVTITSVSQSVGLNGTETINCTTSGAPSSGENVYVRYSSNGYTSSSLVQFTFVGNVGTASIPWPGNGINISFYTYSSNRLLSAIITDVSTYGEVVHDLSTLSLGSGGTYTSTTCTAPGTVTVTPFPASPCSGSSVTFSAISTGSPSQILSYTWSVAGVITNTTSSTYTNSFTGNVTYSCAITNYCGSATSNTGTLTVTNNTTTSNPVSSIVCAEQTATFSVTGGGSNLSYVWEENGNNISGSGTQSIYSGYNTSTLTVTATTGINGYQYVCVVSSSCGSPATSTAATLTVNNPSVGGTANASPSSVCPGGSSTITLSSYTGSTFQWYQSTDNINWSSVSGGSGGNTATYTTPNLDNGENYEAVVTNGICTAATSISALISVTIDDATATALYNGENDNATGFGNWSVTGVGSNGGTFNSNSDNVLVNGNSWAIWAQNSNTLSAALQLSNVMAVGNTLNFEMNCNATGGSMGMSLWNSSNANLMEVYLGASATNLTLADISGNNLTNINGNGTGVQVGVVLTSSTTYDVVITQGSTSTSTSGTLETTGPPTQIRFFDYNPGGSGINFYMNNISLNQPVITAQPSTSGQSLCVGGSATPLTVTAYPAGLSYQWYQNTSSSYASATQVSGVSSSWTPLTATSGNLYYFCVVSSNCTSVSSNISGLIAVNTTPSGSGTISGAGTVCTGVSGIDYSINGVTNASSYSWAVPSGANISAGNGTSAITVSWGTATSGDVYCTPTNGSCDGTVASMAVLVNPNPSASPVANPNPLCPGTQTNISANASGGSGIYSSYTWSPSGSGSAITPSPVVSTTYTVTVIDNNGCSGVGSVTVTITNSNSWSGGSDDQWSNPLNWACGHVPLPTDNVTIPANGVTYMPLIASSVNASCNSITINGSLAFGATGTLLVGTNVTIAGIVDMTNGGSLTLEPNGTFTNNGTFLGGIGSLTIGDNGNLTNNSTFNSGTGTVSFSGATSNVSSIAGTISLYNVNIGGTTCCQGINFSGSTTVTGSLTINTNGYVANNTAPIYGIGSVLIMNTGGTFALYDNTSGNESAGWYRNVVGNGSPQQGIPWNLIINNNTAVIWNSVNDGFPRYLNGGLTINSGSSLTLGGASGGDLNLDGNYYDNGGTFYPNGRAVFFNGSVIQTITTTNGNENFDFLVINNSNSGTGVILSSSPASNVTVNGSVGYALQLINTGSFDLNGQTLTLTNNGGSSNIYVTGNEIITSAVAGGIVSVSGSTTVSNNSGVGTLTFSPNVTVQLYSQIDFGLYGTTAISTIQGIFEILSGAGSVVEHYAPFYSSTSTLEYNCNCNYSASEEWYENTYGTEAGVPQNVYISSGTYLTFGISGYTREMRGNLTLNGTSGLILGGNPGGDLNIKGNWYQDPAATFTPNSRVVNFIGVTGNQTINSINGVTFDGLTINNSTGNVVLSDNITVNQTLTLTSGLINTGTNVVIISSSGTVSGGGTSSYVYGYLQQYVPSGSSVNVDYEIGDANNYTPADLSFASVTVAGNVTANTTPAEQPQIATSGLNPALSLNRYWTLTNSSTSFTTCDITFNFVPGDIPGGANYSLFETEVYNGSAWSSTGTGTLNPTSTQATGVTFFGDFQIGEPAAPGTVTWTDGSGSNNDWSTPGNWSGGQLPQPSNNVIIPTTPSGGINFPVVTTSGAVCNNMTIEADASLTVNGTLTASGSMLIQSNSSGTGVFVQSDGSIATFPGNVTVQRYIPSTGYHYLSTPISNGTVQDFQNSANGTFEAGQDYRNNYNASPLSDFWYYYEPDIQTPVVGSGVSPNQVGWMTTPLTLSSPLVQMQGYAVAISSGKIVQLTGALNSGPLSISSLTNTSSGTPSNDGWNLVGNPYPSTIDWNNAGWTKTNVDNTIYIFDPATYSYYTYNINDPLTNNYVNNNLIPSMQGLFVHVTNPGSGTLSVINSVRTTATSPVFKKAPEQNDYPSLSLTASAQEMVSDKMAICFCDSCTYNIDPEFDVLKLLNSGSNSLNIYSTTEGINFVANWLPDNFSTDIIVPVVVIAPKPGQITIDATSIQNFNSGLLIYLQDSLTGIVQDLSQNPVYQYMADDNNLFSGTRFSVRFTENATSVNSVKGLNSVIANAYSYGNLLHVTYMNPSGENADFILYDLQGQELINRSLNNGTENYEFNLPDGCYIVKIISNDNVYVNKVYVR